MKFKSGIAPIVSIITIVIIVAGIVVAWQYLGEKEQEPVAGQQEEEEEEFVDWQIFRTADDLFEVQYPLYLSDHTLVKGLARAVGYIDSHYFSDPQGPFWGKGLYEFQIDIWQRQGALKENYWSGWQLEENIIIDGYEAKKLIKSSNGEIHQVVYVIEERDIVLKFEEFDSYGLTGKERDQILSTFQFID